MSNGHDNKKIIPLAEPLLAAPYYNIWRDSGLRYLGYANEIGESFRYQFPKLVTPSYVMAFGYCGMDAASAGYRVWNEKGLQQNENSREVRAMTAAFDTLLWQGLASVMIPGATINLIVRASRMAIARTSITKTLPLLAKWIPTGAGISSIPLIIHPIDDFVDSLLDNTTRQYIKM